MDPDRLLGMRRPSPGFCFWCGKAIDAELEAHELVGGALWCGLCPRFPATQALRDAAQFAVRAQRLLRHLEAELLDEFEEELEQLKDTIRDLDMILAQRRGRWPPPTWGPGAPG